MGCAMNPIESDIGSFHIHVPTLVPHTLVDEFHLLVYPIVLGKGLRLFKDGTITNLELVDTKTYSTGVVLLTYHPAPGK